MIHNSSLKKDLKKILKKYNLKPKKYFGQNFLIEKEVLKHILKAAELKKTDIVIEVGPGFGSLTKELAKKVKKVIAVEKDGELARILNNELRIMNIKNVQVIEGDILKVTTNKLKLTNNYKVVANLPYYITSPLIRKFLEEKTPPSLMVLMVQKEVAERICAKPSNMSLLSVSVQFYAKPKIIKIVKKNCFWPVPKVDSAILKVSSISPQKYSLQFKKQFFKIVKAGFSSPRKQLKNNLKNILKENPEKILRQSRINESRRPETLSLKEWIILAKNFKKK